MGTSTTILAATLKVIGDLIKDRFSLALQRSGGRPPEDFTEAIEQHLIEVASWSGTIQFYGMPSALSTDDTSIPLSLDIPRRFRGHKITQELKSELDLLESNHHHVILGDPGAGKTTTLKRLARHLFTSPNGSQDQFQFPIVVRMREISSPDTLFSVLARKLQLFPDTEALGQDVHLRQEGSNSRESSGRLGTARFERAIFSVLNEMCAVLLLDGLDEIAQDVRASMEQEIQRLGWNLSTGKIVLTCRSGDYTRNLEGFEILEICALQPKQVEAIAGNWLASGAPRFFDALKRLPYADIADRPLLLAQLLLLFKRTGYLPESPAQVYRRIINLLLEEWDNERGISRHSKYAGFNPERKREFLAAIAYQLTYKVKRTVFTRADLVSAYESTKHSFGLPDSEAPQVAAEIESHSGIIIDTGDRLEFCHLSLQESLCAEYLVKSPFPEALPSYIRDYPAPLAIAVAMSSDSSSWFSGLFLKNHNWEVFAAANKSMVSFLARLAIERPYFQISPALGFSFLRIAERLSGEEYIETLLAWLDSEIIAQSIWHAYEYYCFHSKEGQLINGYRTKEFANPYGFTTPPTLKVHERIFLELVRRQLRFDFIISNSRYTVNSLEEWHRVIGLMQRRSR